MPPDNLNGHLLHQTLCQLQAPPCTVPKCIYLKSRNMWIFHCNTVAMQCNATVIFIGLHRVNNWFLFHFASPSPPTVGRCVTQSFELASIRGLQACLVIFERALALIMLLTCTWFEQLICKSPTQVGAWTGWLSCQGKQAQAATSSSDLHCLLQPSLQSSQAPSLSMVVALTTTLAPLSPTSTLLLSPTSPT